MNWTDCSGKQRRSVERLAARVRRLRVEPGSPGLAMVQVGYLGTPASHRSSATPSSVSATALVRIRESHLSLARHTHHLAAIGTNKTPATPLVSCSFRGWGVCDCPLVLGVSSLRRPSPRRKNPARVTADGIHPTDSVDETRRDGQEKRAIRAQHLRRLFVWLGSHLWERLGAGRRAS